MSTPPPPSPSNETNIVRKIMLALSKFTNVRIFRNNTGSAWIGQSVKFTKRQTVSVEAGDVLVRQGRFFTAGLCVGSSDLIGIKSVEVTPEMIGKKIAVFTAVEVKNQIGRATKEQIAFIEMVNNLGGIGYIARNESEAVEFMKSKY